MSKARKIELELKSWKLDGNQRKKLASVIMNIVIIEPSLHYERKDIVLISRELEHVPGKIVSLCILIQDLLILIIVKELPIPKELNRVNLNREI